MNRKIKHINHLESHFLPLCSSCRENLQQNSFIRVHSVKVQQFQDPNRIQKSHSDSFVKDNVTHYIIIVEFAF